MFCGHTGCGEGKRKGRSRRVKTLPAACRGTGAAAFDLCLLDQPDARCRAPQPSPALASTYCSPPLCTNSRAHSRPQQRHARPPAQRRHRPDHRKKTSRLIRKAYACCAPTCSCWISFDKAVKLASLRSRSSWRVVSKSCVAGMVGGGWCATELGGCEFKLNARSTCPRY